MGVVVTVIVLLALTAVGVLLIHRLNSQHGSRAAAFHYGPLGTAVPGTAPTSGRRVRGRAVAASGTGERGDRRAGGRGRLRPRRRTHKRPMPWSRPSVDR
ncbi:hypothetical protein GCM10010247_41280 [Streptomyces calvus]|nr:hypothetical protein GCM10010247_41280 [Streptomyces calvus]